MNDDTISSYELRFRKELNQILPNSYDKLYEIESFSSTQGKKILTFLIKYACQSQNLSLIILARNHIKEIPSKWLYEHFQNIAEECICIDDEWEYRRVLELVTEATPSLLKWTIEKGINSSNDEVREAAEDFL